MRARSVISSTSESSRAWSQSSVGGTFENDFAFPWNAPVFFDSLNSVSQLNCTKINLLNSIWTSDQHPTHRPAAAEPLSVEVDMRCPA